MTGHTVGTREEWLAARNQLLERENEHAQRSEELAQQRRKLPWVPVEKEYSFATDEGTKTLAELFDGRSQLLAWLQDWAKAVGTSLESGMAENPSWSAFALDDGVVYTYARSAPDRDFVVPYYQLLLDRTPTGRVDESWAVRRDEYEDAAQ